MKPWRICHNYRKNYNVYTKSWVENRWYQVRYFGHNNRWRPIDVISFETLEMALKATYEAIEDDKKKIIFNLEQVLHRFAKDLYN
jgi:hypothetical protein